MSLEGGREGREGRGGEGREGGREEGGEGGREGRDDYYTYYSDGTLSRRLDRCDRVIQDEVGDSNGGNV